jgi:GNAT superfamily N-acetyltransferase
MRCWAATYDMKTSDRIVATRLGGDHATDIRALYLGLSDASRSLRFGTPMPRISTWVLATLCDVDGNRHVAVGAWASETLVGIAHRIRSPAYPDVYDVALAVADEHQGQGVGSMLLDAMAEDAAKDGVARLTFHLSGDNRAMAQLLARRNVAVRYRGGTGEGEWSIES